MTTFFRSTATDAHGVTVTAIVSDVVLDAISGWKAGHPACGGLGCGHTPLPMPGPIFTFVEATGLKHYADFVTGDTRLLEELLSGHQVHTTTTFDVPFARGLQWSHDPEVARRERAHRTSLAQAVATFGLQPATSVGASGSSLASVSAFPVAAPPVHVSLYKELRRSAA